jgi:hypothetical protein
MTSSYVLRKFFPFENISHLTCPVGELGLLQLLSSTSKPRCSALCVLQPSKVARTLSHTVPRSPALHEDPLQSSKHRLRPTRQKLTLERSKFLVHQMPSSCTARSDTQSSGRNILSIITMTSVSLRALSRRERVALTSCQRLSLARDGSLSSMK